MTNVKQVIRAEVSATVINNLSVGDVYKRVEKSPYSSDSKLLFGTVTDIIANGDEVAITTLEFTSEYGGSADPVLKVWTGGDDLALFPATVEEFEAAHGEAVHKQQLAVDQAERALERAVSILARMRQVALAALGDTPTERIAISDVDLPDGDQP